jgi:hypothetical protein
VNGGDFESAPWKQIPEDCATGANRGIADNQVLLDMEDRDFARRTVMEYFLPKPANIVRRTAVDDLDGSSLRPIGDRNPWTASMPEQPLR